MTFPPADREHCSRPLEVPGRDSFPGYNEVERANETRCDIEPYVLADGSQRRTVESGALRPVARDAADRLGLIRQRLAAGQYELDAVMAAVAWRILDVGDL
jgi:hypothetical protein